MNFLAHLYLSGNSDKVKVGNFIGDWVKGKQYGQYHKEIQQGILLHRAIDSYTDTHEMVRASKQIFAPTYRLYSGIIVDVMLDHFLSVHWQEYSKVPLRSFIDDSYNILLNYSSVFPFRISRIFPSLVYNDWIGQYGSFYGLAKVLNRMAVRTSLPNFTETAIELLKSNYSELESNFICFWPEIIDCCLGGINVQK